MTEETKTVILDANNLAMRAFHAAKHTGMSSGGHHTGALVLFVNSLSKLLVQEQPTHFIAFWDGGGSIYREGVYPGYKLARREAAGGAVPHAESFRLIKEFMAYSRLPSWREEGVEADDLIAAAHRRTPGRKVILSSDKDLLQLIDHETEQVRFTGDIHEDRWDHDRVIKEYGCPPDRLARLMALTGDQSDGIPGLRGIGPKKATKMLSEVDWDWGKLIGQLPPEQAEQAEMCLSLVDLNYLDTIVPSVPEWQAHPRFQEACPSDWFGLCKHCAALLAFCDEFELQSIKERVVGRLLWK